MISPLVPLVAIVATFFLVVVLDILGLRRHCRGIAIAGVVAAAFLFPFARGEIAGFRFDTFSLLFEIVFLSGAFLVLLASKESHGAYQGGVLLSLLGMILSASTNDLLFLYLSIELVTAPTFILVGWHRTRPAIEALVKYLIVSMLASALLVLGLGVLALNAGTTSLSAIHASATPMFLFAISAIIAGLGFKLGVFPFNFWIPDVYQGSPSAIAGLLAGASKKAGFAAFMRIGVVLALTMSGWSRIIAIIAALTMTVPNLIALVQKNAHRMLAYSIMMHAGFLLMGVAVITPISVAGALFHSATHAIAAIGAFLVLGVLKRHRIETLDQFSGIGWRNPLLGVGLAIFLLSLAGMPFLAGFASKVYLFYGVMDEGWIWLGVIAIVNSAISLYYYFTVLRLMFGRHASGRRFDVPHGVLVAIVLCVALIVFFGVWPVPAIDLAQAAAHALF